MGRALRKRGLNHVRKVSSQISLCSLHRLIKDNTFRLNLIIAKKILSLNTKYNTSVKCRACRLHRLIWDDTWWTCNKPLFTMHSPYLMWAKSGPEQAISHAITCNYNSRSRYYFHNLELQFCILVLLIAYLYFCDLLYPVLMFLGLLSASLQYVAIGCSNKKIFYYFLPNQTEINMRHFCNRTRHKAFKRVKWSPNQPVQLLFEGALPVVIATNTIINENGNI